MISLSCHESYCVSALSSGISVGLVFLKEGCTIVLCLPTSLS